MTSVSVIIPNYNRASLIGETIENILGQSLPPLEVIVVDDGSTDNSIEVLKKFGNKIKLIKQNNRGPGAARNAGLRVASGAFIQFFDSDDLMTSNKLEVQVRLLESNTEADLVYGPYVMAEKVNGEWKQTEAIIQYFPLPPKPLNAIVTEGWCAITQSCLFRKEVIENAGPWREDLMPHEDKEYWYRLGKMIRRSLHENESCVFYRQHSQQITDLQVRTMTRTLDGIKAFDMILEQSKIDHVPVLSRMMCAGMRAGYVKYLNRNSHFEIQNTWTDEIYYMLYRVVQKAGRMKTKTNWQPHHGALNSPEKFASYKRLLGHN